MKKFGIALLLFALLGTMVFACAESTIEIDLSGYSLDELLQIHEQVVEAMAEKGYSKSAVLAVGKYTVGVDIPAGTYTVELSDTAGPDNEYFDYAIRDEDDTRIAGESLCDAATRIILSEGNILTIDRAPVRIRTYAILWE